MAQPLFLLQPRLTAAGLLSIHYRQFARDVLREWGEHGVIILTYRLRGLKELQRLTDYLSNYSKALPNGGFVFCSALGDGENEVVVQRRATWL